MKQNTVFSFQCLFGITTIEEYVKSKLRHLHLQVFHLLASLHLNRTELLMATLTVGDEAFF